MPQQQVRRQFDLSGAMQTASSRLLRKRNEVELSENAEFNRKIGSFARRFGYEQVGYTIQGGKDGLGAHVYKYGTNSKVFTSTNNANDTSSILTVLDNGGYWTPVLTLAPNTRLNIIDSLEESYVVGASDNGTFMTPTVIDQTLTPVTDHSVVNMPKCKYVVEYGGRLYAINCLVNGVRYPDRAYQSSVASGPITFVQGDQQGLLKQILVDTVKYLKPGMQVDIYKAGKEAKLATALTIISVDKDSQTISFLDSQLILSDNDEIWLTGRKGKLTYFWNVDYPTPEDADWLRVPPGTDSRPEFRGYGVNNNRLFLFTKNSFLKWDGANLITVSPTVGCVSHETIKNIGSWTIWLHTTGVWGYNDSTGQLKLLSRTINNYIQAIQQNSMHKASANVVGRVYKVSVGELLAVDQPTTSTSTSSTSTSSTSSSTSSTSTSSTSTSSTSSSTSSTNTTTSTSSTSTSSTSTSSTSHSTSSTSTSISTSSTSTSMSTSSTTTTTAISTRKVARFVYDFDMNAWWIELHRREIRFQFNHNMTGYEKPYFLDDTGRLFRDEVGNRDHMDTIPMRVKIGRDAFGTSAKKKYLGAFFQSEFGRGATIRASVDNGDFKPLGQLREDVEKIDFPEWVQGRDINYEITHDSIGEAPVIDGPETYYVTTENSYGAGR